MEKYNEVLVNNLNENIKKYFPHLFLITEDMHKRFEGVSRLVMLDRYTQKDINLQTLAVGDLVLTIIKNDPKFPARGVGYVVGIEDGIVTIKLEEEYTGIAEDINDKNEIIRKKSEIDKPLEIYFEQIAKRVANNLAQGETEEDFKNFYHEISELNLVPAGRVLFGAGSKSQVTYFNCFVMPNVHDSRGGISDHRRQVMEIMSRGGGVGTNGSTLRPKNSLAKGVSGKSSGAVSWLNDLSQLTHLVEQGGSRRGAQMIMLSVWHPDIIDFIISKMQNPKILQFLIDNIDDEEIVRAAKNKLKFVPLTEQEIEIYDSIVNLDNNHIDINISKATIELARKQLDAKGRYTVHNEEFLSGANISVAITNDFMGAVENDEYFDLRFPDVDNYSQGEKAAYNEKWQNVGDVREWEKLGYRNKVHRRIKAKNLWNLINICATYSAEPGIFFIDNANEMTNAVGYDQKVVCTNPCGEQPLAPYSVCNLAAINLSNMVDKKKQDVDWTKLKNTIINSIKMQDNVIDQTTYFLEENKHQALGERRIGMGIMGLHDLLIWCNKRYGSKEGNELVDRVMMFMAVTAYETSIELAKTKGSFPFLEQYGSKEKFINSGYMRKMPKHIRDGILKYGIRNSHLLTIAPTGSTGTMVGVSTGLEPYFAFTYYRSGRLGKYIEVNAPVVDEYLKFYPQYSPETLPNIFVSAMDLTPEEHADIQCVIQRWVDSSISKTVNAPKGFTVEDVEAVYTRLYHGGAKGGTVYVDGSRDAQVLTLSKEDSLPQQTNIEEFGVEVEHIKKPKKENTITPPNLKANKDIGIEVGDICPICLEGTVEEIGGCNTCTNCNAQLKCGL